MKKLFMVSMILAIVALVSIFTCANAFAAPSIYTVTYDMNTPVSMPPLANITVNHEVSSGDIQLRDDTAIDGTTLVLGDDYRIQAWGIHPYDASQVQHGLGDIIPEPATDITLYAHWYIPCEYDLGDILPDGGTVVDKYLSYRGSGSYYKGDDPDYYKAQYEPLEFVDRIFPTEYPVIKYTANSSAAANILVNLWDPDTAIFFATNSNFIPRLLPGNLVNNETSPSRTGVSGLLRRVPGSFSKVYYNSYNTHAQYDSNTNSFILFDNLLVATSAGHSRGGAFMPFSWVKDGVGDGVVSGSTNTFFNTLNGVQPPPSPQLLQHQNVGSLLCNDMKKLVVLGAADQLFRFGMKVQGQFYQYPGGVDPMGGDLELSFCGDDVIYIYIDGMRVLSAGTVSYGPGAISSINFATGEIFESPSGITTTLYDRYIAAGATQAELDEIFTSNGSGGFRFKDNTAHEMVIYYADTGRVVSRLGMEMNLEFEPPIVSADIPFSKALTGDVPDPNDPETFEFILTPIHPDYPYCPMPAVGTENGENVQTIEGAGNGNFGNIYFREPGEYIYSIKEVAGSNADYTYDETEYILTILIEPYEEDNTVKYRLTKYIVKVDEECLVGKCGCDCTGQCDCVVIGCDCVLYECECGHDVCECILEECLCIPGEGQCPPIYVDEIDFSNAYKKPSNGGNGNGDDDDDDDDDDDGNGGGNLGGSIGGNSSILPPAQLPTEEPPEELLDIDSPLGSSGGALRITKELAENQPSIVGLGSDIKYIIKVTNLRSNTLEDILVTDEMEGETHELGTIDSLAPNETREFTFTYRVPSDMRAGTRIRNYAYAERAGGARVSAYADATVSMFVEYPHLWYIRGYTDNTIRPNANISRAEIVMAFYRLLKPELKNIDAGAAFRDVSEDEWYGLAVNCLAYHDIVGGYPDGSFLPNQPITRREMAAVVSRFDQLLETDENPYNDLDRNDWAYEYILSATKKGWFIGSEAGRFRPEDNITRAEFVTVANRILNRRLLPEDVPSDVHKFDDFSSSHWSYVDFMESIYTHGFNRKADGVYENWLDILGSGLDAEYNQ